MHTPQYLYVSFLNSDSGFGHAMRAFACARECVPLGHAIDIVLSSGEEAGNNVSTSREYKALVSMHAELLSSPQVHLISCSNTELRKHYDAVFLDVKEMSYKTFRFYQSYGFCIGLDLGGQARECVPYLIDTLPNFLSKPNIYDPAGFVDASMPRRERPPHECARVLFYAPHTDYGQYSPVLEVCRAYGVQCTLVQGAREHDEDAILKKNGIHFMPFSKNFAHTLSEYDLLITHFGLSAFEAVYAGVPVLLVNPSTYHSALGKKAGFTHNYRSYKHAASVLMRCVRNAVYFQTAASSMTAGVVQAQYGGVRVYDRLLTCAEKIRGWYGKKSPVNPFDPVGDSMPRALWRDEEKSVFACRKTKLIFQVPFSDAVSYNDAYFFSDYKAQYGKTYLEDFDAICTKMEERLNIIERLSVVHSKAHSPRLLDLGCAYGAMLKTARKRSFVPCGVDINKEACDYVRNTLDIPALCTSVFEEGFLAKHARFVEEHGELVRNVSMSTQKGALRYDVVSCWYVLEHTPNFDAVLKTVWHLLAPGGIFALAVPNGRGISARRHFTRFLQVNPIDHFSIFSPKPLRALLQKRGFRFRAMRVTGHHPSRVVPAGLKWTLVPPLRSIVIGLSKLLRLGDTFELYLEKTG